MTTVYPGADLAPIWTPSPDVRDAANLEHFRHWVNDRHGLALADYHALHAWSVTELERFWGSLWDYFDVRAATAAERVLAERVMPNTRWFPGARLNYVDHVLRHAERSGAAVIGLTEPGGPAGRTLSWAELRRQVGAVAHTLRELGVQEGDRVVGYLPDIPEAVVAFLATASIGAVWAVCGQDYAAPAAAARLAQLDPVVLITADGYGYAGRLHDRREAVARLRTELPSLRGTILIPRLGSEPDVPDGTVPWDQVSSGDHPPVPAPVAFDHPLWVLFTSGTTGKPKGIVHGHGGILLEHLKMVTLQYDLKPEDTYFGYTSPSWMMWNVKVSVLLTGATIVCYDGNPAYPAPDTLWTLAAGHGATVLQTSPPYLDSCHRLGLHPAVDHDLSRLRNLRATGSVLPPETSLWAARELGPQVAVTSSAGGTDVASGLAGAVPTLPIYAGELTAPCLGVALEAWDNDGNSVRDRVGELVVTEPMPSMPLGFWNDPDGQRYRSAYFETFPGVWWHGDSITVTHRGSVIIHGRSDATLNRNGVRLGSADIYQVVEQLPEIAESLVIGVELPDGGYWMPLFVSLAGAAELTPELKHTVTTAIRENASPRHVPDEIIAVPGIPHTLTGKKLEVPIKRILQGTAPRDALDPESVDMPQFLDAYVRIAETSLGTATRPPANAE
ncbi:acetoacetate--CoA ligase [Streptomyces mirabilis]|uniref:acetoacetate--CoA ligase n=1 Tax=Streptomyces mirabilis TaxID=68239 RepID=UPI00368DFF11